MNSTEAQVWRGRWIGLLFLANRLLLLVVVLSGLLLLSLSMVRWSVTRPDASLYTITVISAAAHLVTYRRLPAIARLTGVMANLSLLIGLSMKLWVAASTAHPIAVGVAALVTVATVAVPLLLMIVGVRNEVGHSK